MLRVSLSYKQSATATTRTHDLSQPGEGFVYKGTRGQSAAPEQDPRESPLYFPSPADSVPSATDQAGVAPHHPSVVKAGRCWGP